MPRLFVGLEPDGASRRALGEWAKAVAKVCPGRYYDAGLYHVTLCFLGQVQEERMGDLRALLSALRFGPTFPLRVGPAGSFKQGRVVFASVQTPCPELMALQKEIARLLADDLPREERERPYTPHITLCRHGTGCQGAPLPPDIAWTVRAFTLFESTRVEGRLAYVPLLRVPLQGAEEVSPC